MKTLGEADCFWTTRINKTENDCHFLMSGSFTHSGHFECLRCRDMKICVFICVSIICLVLFEAFLHKEMKRSRFCEQFVPKMIKKVLEYVQES